MQNCPCMYLLFPPCVPASLRPCVPPSLRPSVRPSVRPFLSLALSVTLYLPLIVSLCVYISLSLSAPLSRGSPHSITYVRMDIPVSACICLTVSLCLSQSIRPPVRLFVQNTTHRVVGERTVDETEFIDGDEILMQYQLLVSKNGEETYVILDLNRVRSIYSTI